VVGCSGFPSFVVMGVNATALFVDATGLYWGATDPDGGVYKMPLDGGSPVLVAHTPTSSPASFIAANADCVYFSIPGNLGGGLKGQVRAAPQP
jgi:hypothetical protein